MFLLSTGTEGHLCEVGEGTAGYGTIGRNRDGGFTEYLAIPSENIIKLPSSISNAVGSIVTDACATSFNSVQQVDLEFDDTVVVFGCGGLGLCAIKYLSLSNHIDLVAVDLKTENLRRAAQFGADTTINAANDEHLDEIRRITGGRGADIAFEFTGAAPAMEDAVACLRPNGTAVITGCAECEWSIPGDACCLDAINVKGTHGFTHQQIIDIISLIEAGKVTFDDMISHRFTLDDVNRAIDYLDTPTAIDEEVRRIVIETKT